MKPITKFWLCALSPIIFIAVGIISAFIFKGGPSFLFYDSFYFSWIFTLLLAVFYWKKAFRYAGWLKRILALIVPAFLLVVAFWAIFLEYSSSIYFGPPLFPWVAAELGFPTAQFRMAVSKEILLDDEMEGLKHRILAKDETHISWDTWGEIYRQKKQEPEKWLQKSLASGCIGAEYKVWIRLIPSHMWPDGHWGWNTLSAQQLSLWSSEGLKNLEAAAEQTEPNSLFILAGLYEKGEGGLPQDQNKAGLLYKQAVELSVSERNLSDIESMKKMASIYAEGSNGLTKDLNKSDFWQRSAQERQEERRKNGISGMGPEYCKKGDVLDKDVP